jgi:signal transduction histidine kinase
MVDGSTPPDMHWTPWPLNLVLNGIEAAGTGSIVEVGVGIEETRSGRKGAIRVTDSGPGVPHDLRERVFNPFFTTRQDGVGLGLSICARIVEEHKGSIDIDDAPGGGARFTVLVPAAIAPARGP